MKGQGSAQSQPRSAPERAAREAEPAAAGNLEALADAAQELARAADEFESASRDHRSIVTNNRLLSAIDGVRTQLDRPATRPNYRVVLRELMEAAMSCQDFWVVNFITARLANDDYVPPSYADLKATPHVFSPTEFGGDECKLCGRDVRDGCHVRGAK